MLLGEGTLVKYREIAKQDKDTLFVVLSMFVKKGLFVWIHMHCSFINYYTLFFCSSEGIYGIFEICLNIDKTNETYRKRIKTKV